MRWIVLTLLIVPLLVAAGCTQTASTPSGTAPTPTLTPSIVVITPTPTPQPVIADGQMQIDVTARQVGHDVIVSYNGGPSAPYLLALDITIYNNNGQTVSRIMRDPQPGDEYTFPYTGTPDPNNVDVVGIFVGGVEQTVLLDSV